MKSQNSRLIKSFLLGVVMCMCCISLRAYDIHAVTYAPTDTTVILDLLQKNQKLRYVGETCIYNSRQALAHAKNLDNQLFIGLSELSLSRCLSNTRADSALIYGRSGMKKMNGIPKSKHKVNALQLYARILEKQSLYDSSLIYLNRAAALSKEINYYKGLADAQYVTAQINNLRGKKQVALRNAIDALSYYKKAGLIEDMGSTYNQIGIIYDELGRYPEAMTNYLSARDIAAETGNMEEEIRINNNLGVLQDNLNNPSLALKYYNTAYEKAAISNDQNISLILNNISYINLKSGDTTLAIQSLRKAIQINREANIPCEDIYPMEGLASIYVDLKAFDSAQAYLKRTLQMAEDCEDIGVIASLKLNYGKMYQYQKKYKLSESYLLDALRLSTQANIAQEIQRTQYQLFSLYKDRGQVQKALSFLENYQRLSDSVTASRNEEKATQMMVDYEFNEKMDLIEDEQRIAEIKHQEELNSRQRINIVISIALFLLLLLILTLWRSYYLIQTQNKQLKWINEEKNTLLGMVAHDLRNPLNIIKGMIDLIKDTKPEPEEMDQYFGILSSSSDRMRNMIDQVLDISALENMKLKVNFQETNITDLLNNTFASFKLVASQKKITILKKFSLPPQTVLQLDPNYFEQVMDNLVSNAIKFSLPQKQIIIQAEKQDRNVIIQVIDEGPGLDKIELERLFIKFQPLSSKPTANEKSTGLGLSIVKKLVDAMEGDIKCISVKGKGTTFILKFPVS